MFVVCVCCQIMYNSLRLYADNLLCMDLCCWSSTEATQLLGTEVSGAHTVYTVSRVSVCVCCTLAVDAASSSEEARHEGDLGLPAHGGGQTR